MKIAVGITGASGSIYAKLLIERLSELGGQISGCGLVFSDSAKEVWKHELGEEIPRSSPFPVYSKKDFSAPFASGSAGYAAVIICPCSMGTLGRIASGVSDDLITRAADVALKERRKLVLVTRETPLSLVHIRNMAAVTEAGGIVLPASPSFYSPAAGINDICLTVVNRALELCGINTGAYSWGQGSQSAQPGL
jgi:flavin prenyltransferase